MTHARRLIKTDIQAREAGLTDGWYGSPRNEYRFIDNEHKHADYTTGYRQGYAAAEKKKAKEQG